jgi:alpha-glucuronidase
MMRKKIVFRAVIFLIPMLAGSLAASAQTADQAWLRYRPLTIKPDVPIDVMSMAHFKFLFGPKPSFPEDFILPASALPQLSAEAETARGIRSFMGLVKNETEVPRNSFPRLIMLGTREEIAEIFPNLKIPPLEAEDFWLYSVEDKSEGTWQVLVVGGTNRGVVYGAFALLRRISLGEDAHKLDVKERPAMPIRWVDEWDNPDGSIERGYAGRSIFFEGGNVRQDLAPVAEYARLLASVGINGLNINNVNADPQLLDSDHLKQLTRVADVLRPWGVRLAVSVDIASPQKIGGLATFDPLDPAVRAWWTAKTNEIYALIPDFGGFTVKADSEGQPGPASYGRTPADAANLLAAALAPHGGIVLYRAFVYNHHLDWRDPKADRARAAYDIFHPLDGKFGANVVIQTKEGPIDFQVREPVSPLFAGLERTNQAMELQVTQEYTGQQRHLVYLAPMWKQVLDFDLRAGGQSTPVKEIIAGKSFHRPLGGMVAVAGVGRDEWLGSPLALANLYAFGRLAWNPDLTPEEIAAEWTRQTISTDPEVVQTVVKMLMQSWPAYENYTGPLGLQTLTDITGSHYGPNIESSEHNGWGMWHRADKDGVGMDRSVATGTGFAGQYPPEVAKLYEDAATTPDELLLFFHHVPYTYKLHSGKTVIQFLYDSHYEGAEQAANFARTWAKLEGRIDQPLYEQVRDRLRYQAGHSIVWRDAIVQYFLKLSGIPDEKGRAGHYPGRLEAEDARLNGYKIIDVTPWEDASGGKAVSCEDLAPIPIHSGTPNPVGTNSVAAPALYQGTTSVVPNATQKEVRVLAPVGTKTCSAEWTWNGAEGRYNIAIQYFDLQVGVAHFTLKVNGQPFDAWAADATLPSRRPHGDNSIRRTLQNVELRYGDILRVEGTSDEADPAAFDYIEVTPVPSQY